jgi:2-amino-4-hydroxy-6-hydroxymethyldihydropteridine diphosphokinase
VARVYISIGSNIERETNIRAGLQALRARFGHLSLSPVYESAPIGFEGDDFFNLVAGFDTEDTAPALIAALHEIERAHGRTRDSHGFAARTLDLDLLYYGDGEISFRPRPEATGYACVLRPLAELAPALRDPVSGERYADLWARFDKNSQPLRRVEKDISV